MNRFKDVYRQATIDMMLGNSVSEEVFLERTEEEDNAATAVHVKLLIEDCKKLLIPDPEIILGSWGVIDADPMYVWIKSNICYNKIFLPVYFLIIENFISTDYFP